LSNEDAPPSRRYSNSVAKHATDACYPSLPTTKKKFAQGEVWHPQWMILRKLFEPFRDRQGRAPVSVRTFKHASRQARVGPHHHRSSPDADIAAKKNGR